MLASFGEWRDGLRRAAKLLVLGNPARHIPCGITAQLQIVLNDSFGREPLPAAAAAPDTFARFRGRRRLTAGLATRRNPKASNLPVMPLRLFAFGAGERPRNGGGFVAGLFFGAARSGRPRYAPPRMA